MQPVAMWVQSLFRGMFTIFSGGAVVQFKGYDRPMEFFLARDWYQLGKDILPGIRNCPAVDAAQARAVKPAPWMPSAVMGKPAAKPLANEGQQ